MASLPGRGSDLGLTLSHVRQTKTLRTHLRQDCVDCRSGSGAEGACRRQLLVAMAGSDHDLVSTRTRAADAVVVKGNTSVNDNLVHRPARRRSQQWMTTST